MQVDGKSNPQIQSIRLEKFPVHRAAFSRDGETVIATSLRNKMFYLYDMMEGKVTPVTSVRGTHTHTHTHTHTLTPRFHRVRLRRVAVLFQPPPASDPTRRVSEAFQKRSVLPAGSQV